jgi:predicted DNA-binding transcriptional regulator AlpA
MGRRVDVDDLLTASQVATIIGLSHANSVTTYLRRYGDFPRPILDRSGGRVRLWLRQEIEDWVRSR